MAPNILDSLKIWKKMDLALSIIQTAKSGIRDSTRTMNTMDKGKKYMKMDIIILVCGMAWMIIFFINTDLELCIIKKVRLYIKEYGKTISIKSMKIIRFKIKNI